MRKKDNSPTTEEFSNDLESHFRKLSLNSTMSGIGTGPKYYNAVKTRLLSVDEAAAIEEKQFKVRRSKGWLGWHTCYENCHEMG